MVVLNADMHSIEENCSIHLAENNQHFLPITCYAAAMPFIQSESPSARAGRASYYQREL